MKKLGMRNRERGAVFRQSLWDFPCPVSLGEKIPSFGLYRFKQGLRFVPLDDEGFDLRGDKQRLLYKGRRRSHRFTILGDCAFEYDCILEREPESNVISLRMEGAENFDFFRQPDFVPDKFLKGSYAVYKKETLVGEGTGKLCHIHRPEIIDARGRRCWGELSIVSNELYITIPEQWLGEAKYPVIVDPTIGTATVGSQYKWDADPPEPMVQLVFEGQLPVNRFLVSDAINGLCTAYMYSYVDNYGENGGRPVLYSDNGNKPLARKSMNEGFADFTVKSGKPAGWRSATFNSNGSIASGSYIWFGVFTDFFWEPRFDYGLKCYTDYWCDVGSTIPNTYPLPNANSYENFKLSMYFTYTAAQNYVRTLTQGVKLTDSRKLTGAYKRGLTQTAKVNSALGRFETFYRKCAMTAGNSMSIKRLPVFFRKAAENINVTTAIKNARSMSRKCNDTVKVNMLIKRIHTLLQKMIDGLAVLDTRKLTGNYKRGLTQMAGVSSVLSRFETIIRKCVMTAGNSMNINRLPVFFRTVTENINVPTVLKSARSMARKCNDTVQVNSLLKRMPTFFQKIIDGISVSDTKSVYMFYSRKLQGSGIITDRKSHWGNFIREIPVTAGNNAEAKHEAKYHRFNFDTVNADGKANRSLFLFIRIVTKVFIRDYILSRFLIAREEFKLKSVICREIILESKID